jgi:hypothetical protein
MNYAFGIVVLLIVTPIAINFLWGIGAIVFDLGRLLVAPFRRSRVRPI